MSLEDFTGSDSEAQYQRWESGKSLENTTAKIIADVLGPHENIYASTLGDLRRLGKTNKEYEEILAYAETPIRSPCNQNFNMELPDTDVLVYYIHRDFSGKPQRYIHLATISCKVSFHGRYTEPAFWGAILKSNDRKYLVVAEDNERELSTCEKNIKTRRVLEHFTDGVYLIKQYEERRNDIFADESKFFEIYQSNQGNPRSKRDNFVFDQPRASAYCPQVRPFDDLLFHLIQWKTDWIERMNRSKGS